MVSQKSQKEASNIKGPKKNFEFSTAKKPSEWNLIILMFAVSAMFILCVTPYFFWRIFIKLIMNMTSGIQRALMLPFFNSLFNPIIYSIFSPKLL